MPRILAFFVLSAVLLSGCSSLRFPGVYRIDIPQGNMVTQDMLAGLKPGMTPDQVRYVLGPATLTDPFTPNTWYYVLNYRPGNGELVEQQIVVYFENGQFSRYEGEALADLRQRTSAQRDRELERKAEDRKENPLL